MIGLCLKGIFVPSLAFSHLALDKSSRFVHRRFEELNENKSAETLETSCRLIAFKPQKLRKMDPKPFSFTED